MKVRIQVVMCAVCGRRCRRRRGGWFCVSCECFTETDVEVED